MWVELQHYTGRNLLWLASCTQHNSSDFSLCGWYIGSFLLLSATSLYDCMSLLVLLLHIRFSSWGLLWMKLLWIFLYMSFCGHRLAFLLDKSFWMANKHIIRCSASSIIRKYRVKPQWYTTAHLLEWVKFQRLTVASATARGSFLLWWFLFLPLFFFLLLPFGIFFLSVSSWSRSLVHCLLISLVSDEKWNILLFSWRWGLFLSLAAFYTFLFSLVFSSVVMVCSVISYVFILRGAPWILSGCLSSVL